MGEAVKPQMDEYWVARIKYWPEDKERVDVVCLFYVWENGNIDFIPFNSADGDPIRSTQCAHFELLEKIEVEKYK